MEFGYQHANPYGGHESYYLKFHDRLQDQTHVILVDSGDGVDVSDLGANEHLTAILLTHSHVDHYKTLPKAAQENVPIYTSPATAKIVQNVLEEGVKNYAIEGSPEDAIGHITPVTDWKQILPDVDIRPVPAGHTPGGSGFAVRFKSAGEDHHILCTGDFNYNRVAGYPGMQTSYPDDIDVVFLNAVSDDEGDDLTESLKSIREHTQSGGPVLVCTGGLTGVHYAYILGHLIEQSQDKLNINLVGHLAKLYNNLDYDVPNVTAIPQFDSTEGLLGDGTICIAGPEVPDEGAAGRLFNTIKDDPAASVIQITSSGKSGMTDGACTTLEYKYQNHPSTDALHRIVEQTAPVHTIIEHGRVNEYGDVFDFTFTWANNDTDTYTLFKGGDWEAPPWVNPGTEHMIKSENSQRNRKVIKANEYREVERLANVNLQEEGVDTGRFRGVSDDSVPIDATPDIEPEPETEPEQEESEPEPEPVSEEPASASEAPASNGDSSTVTASAPDSPAPPEGGGVVQVAADGHQETTTESKSKSGEQTNGDLEKTVEELAERVQALESKLQSNGPGRIVQHAANEYLIRVPADAVPEDVGHGDSVHVNVEKVDH